MPAINKLWGGKIVKESSFRLQEALKDKTSLFDLVAATNLENMQEWADYLRSKNVPFIIIHLGPNGKDYRKNYILLKRQWCWFPSTKSYHLKSCKCNPLNGEEFCQACSPASFWDKAKMMKEAA